MRTILILTAALAAAACGTTPAAPEEVRATEQRLVSPFLRGTEVGCNELLVEMTGNFNPCVGQPAVDASAHTMRREKGAGYIDTIWTNTLGQPATAFRVTIGQQGDLVAPGATRGPATTFTVLNQFRLRVYEGRHALTLKAYARGDLVVVREASVPRPRDVREYAVEDGVLKVQ